MNEISPILLVGIGFFLGVLFSINILDKIYKEVMKKALDEVGRQYKKALNIVKGRREAD